MYNGVMRFIVKKFEDDQMFIDLPESLGNLLLVNSKVD